jgi:hypothetical protein
MPTAAATLNDKNNSYQQPSSALTTVTMLAWPNTTLWINLRNKVFLMLLLHWAQRKLFFIAEFLYSNSSTPRNFTFFAFHKQEPNSNNCQNNYLICHLLRIEGQKQKVVRRNKSFAQTSSSHTFRLQWTPAFCCRIKHLLWC